jgi:2-amino-4-hydroxy-6-hydroxymethyldihydropteridine diphosphokinase
LTTVYLSLGSNLGDREGSLRAAVERLDVRHASPIYETSPVDFTEQPFFLNMVVETATELTPLQYLARTQAIEREFGRVRGIPKGPRVIDIDILMFGTRLVQTSRLEVPHPRMHERRFVLTPFADLAPDLRHPVTGQTIREMLDALPEGDLVQRWSPLPKL